MNFANSGNDGFIVRLRGLPWSVGKEEVANFLAGCEVVGVNFTYTRDGRPSGEAYVEMSSENDVQMALSKNQQHMGKRYIEVFRSKRSEMDWVIEKDGSGSLNMRGSNDSVVRLRGLPFSCTHEDISNFFRGMQIVTNGIALLADHMGRASGEAYVQFSSQSIADLALQKHKEKMGSRYIEIFKSSMMEAEQAIATQGRFIPGMGATGGGSGRPSPYDRVGGGRGMRGGGARGAGRGRGIIKGLMSHIDDDYDGYGGYGNGAGYGDMGMGYGGGGSGYGAYGSRGGGGRSGSMRGMGGGRMRGGGGGGGGGGGLGGLGMMKSQYYSSTGYSVHMRGLPYAATESDILQFFSPLNPILITIQYNDTDGRPSGEADVDFATELEAQQAMKKHKALMERRYIELFLNCSGGGGGAGFDLYEGGGFEDELYGLGY